MRLSYTGGQAPVEPESQQSRVEFVYQSSRRSSSSSSKHHKHTAGGPSNHKFRSDVAHFVVASLSRYKTDTVEKEKFKHIAKKLTTILIQKESKRHSHPDFSKEVKKKASLFLSGYCDKLGWEKRNKSSASAGGGDDDDEFTAAESEAAAATALDMTFDDDQQQTDQAGSTSTP